MTVTWIGEGGVFTRIGKLFKAFLIFEAWQKAGTNTVPDLEDEILDALGDDRELVSGFYEAMESIRFQPDSWKSMLVPYAEGVIRSLADELNAPSDDLVTVWPLFLARMKADAQTVLKNTAAVGTITPGGDNLGNGKLIVSAKDVDNLASEILIAEVLRVLCIADAGTGAGDGRETFQISGEIPASSRVSYEKRGTGVGNTGSVANASFDNAVLNSDFEDFTVANTPDSWDIDAGTVGTHILKSTSCYRGASALKFVGDGAEAIIGVSQTFTAGRISPSRKYALGVWIKTAGVTAGTITVRLAGTGFAPEAEQRIEIPSAWPTDWTFYSCFVDSPALIPADLKIVVGVTGTLNNTATVLIDGLALIPTAEHHGLYWAFFAGSAPFAAGDVFTFPVTNNEAGVFQTLFGRLWDEQLPSATSPSETISDALCS